MTIDATAYHQATKHDFNRFARSLGYLDWATQPDPFRRFGGSSTIELPRVAYRSDEPYSTLFRGGAPPAPFDLAAIGEFLRCSLGLSAWKQHGRSRWALRVNPSSGNLHPTEGYIVRGGRVCHYAPREHALELRATLAPAHSAADATSDPMPEGFLVGLTSILWREAWKYGERAFRYCQHDVGHAIGALRFAAGLLGWQVVVLDEIPDGTIAGLLGVDRVDDFADAEREEAECLVWVSAERGRSGASGETRGAVTFGDVARLADAAREGTWSGRANRLSPSHVEWPAIDQVAAVTRAPLASPPPRSPASAGPIAARADEAAMAPTARQIILQRRSAVGFDARTSLPLAPFSRMLDRLLPGAPPWDAIGWSPQVHLVLFVHRVDGLTPGVYVYLRDVADLEALRGALRADFLWEPHAAREGEPARLFLLVPSDVRWPANRLSCDQDIAADGFFSLGMLARFSSALAARGDAFYRRLFWECGLIGQALYLEAEAAGGRATGIGCFYDDRVHEVLGLQDTSWQSLYHFSMGVPVDDGRLTTEPGYEGGW